MKKWYAVYTRSHTEQQAAIQLGNQGFNVYLPRYRKSLRHARRIEEVLRPLFSRYLFVELDLDAQAWWSVNGTRGVVRLVTFGDTPSAVPESVMEDLRARETEDGSILLARPDMKQGDRVQIIDGPFAETVALFDHMTDDRRAMLLLDLLGQTVRVRAPVRSLEPVA